MSLARCPTAAGWTRHAPCARRHSAVEAAGWNPQIRSGEMGWTDCGSQRTRDRIAATYHLF